MTLTQIDNEYLLSSLSTMLNLSSPTGYTHQVLSYIQVSLESFPDLNTSLTPKGALVAEWLVPNSESACALTAHVDTLGAMVKEIKPNGRLKLTRIGGYYWNTVEGEGCKVFAHNGEMVRGSLLLVKASSHVYGSKVNELKREDENMEVRLDARTKSANDTRALGIEVGDFVAFDPRVEVTNGFIRSRHLDDKAGVACILAAVKSLRDADLLPARNTYFHFSNYEEVGHGAAAGIPPQVTELLAVDMAAIGDGQNSDEFHATLCVKDSGGPYHFGLNKRLRRLAEEHSIAYKVDVYPHYGSDGEAYWRAGGDVAVALIGPGVDASHNYERTHLEALTATTQWVLAYLLSD
jgi:putative aminopeptidase FrvX